MKLREAERLRVRESKELEAAHTVEKIKEEEARELEVITVY